MLEAMVTAKKAPAKKAPVKQAKEEPPTLAEIGRTAAEAAQREALLSTLNEAEWNLSEAARRLGMHTAGNVIRYIKRLDLEAEYNAAHKAGLIRPGGRL